jgi:hypothetical protein
LPDLPDGFRMPSFSSVLSPDPSPRSRASVLRTEAFSSANRQIVVLRPEDWAAWIHLTKTEAELLRPLPHGSLDVATVREGSG